jgi:hypothetical protein
MRIAAATPYYLNPTDDVPDNVLDLYPSADIAFHCHHLDPCDERAFEPSLFTHMNVYISDLSFDRVDRQRKPKN